LSTSSLTKEIRLALLASYKDLSDEQRTFPTDILKFMRTEKWLHTRHGFRSPRNCVLFDSSWEPIIPVASLPFIDDSDSRNGTGKEIYSYKELRALGVTVDFNQGAELGMSCLSFAEGQQNIVASTIADSSYLLTSSTLLALLKCMQRSAHPGSGRIRKMQIKSTLGYHYADQCILYDSTWSCYLNREDGPFIDEAFYGPDILSYKAKLRLTGVVVDVGFRCSLLAQELKHFSRGDSISRVYKYLGTFKWEPRNKGES
jgi:sacsin